VVAPPRPLVLVTRPAAQAAREAEALARMGCAALPWPVLEIAILPPPDGLGEAQAVLASSANAFAGVRGDARPAFCVGAATAQAARAAGFANARSAAGDSADLAALVAASLDPAAGPLLFLRGETVAGDLTGALRDRGFAVREHVAYAARPTGPPPAAVAQALSGGALAAALFYSPRSASAFAAQAAPFRDGLGATTAVCISANAAAPVAEVGFGAVVVAQAPDAQATRAALAAAVLRRGVAGM
jgi:uroporphyrinogen-III synthase